MGKFVFLVILAGITYYLHSTGILNSLDGENKAIEGKDCEIASPYSSGVYVGATKNLAAVPIDATIGTEYLRAPAKIELSRCLRNGSIIKVADRTKVRVLKNDKVKLYAIPHQLVKVKLLSGDYKGSLGWVERDRVIDTPLQQVYHQLLKPGRLQNEQME